MAAPIFYVCDDVAKMDKALDCNSRNVGSNPTIVSMVCYKGNWYPSNLLSWQSFVRLLSSSLRHTAFIDLWCSGST